MAVSMTSGVASSKHSAGAVGANAVTVLDAGTTISGQVTLSGQARVGGKIDGDIDCQGELTLTETSVVRGDVRASYVFVGGEVKGNILGTELVHLLSTAKVAGRLDTKSLVIDEGASYEGECRMERPVEESLILPGGFGDYAGGLAGELERDITP